MKPRYRLECFFAEEVWIPWPMVETFCWKMVAKSNLTYFKELYPAIDFRIYDMKKGETL